MYRHVEQAIRNLASLPGDEHLCDSKIYILYLLGYDFMILIPLLSFVTFFRASTACP
jgi:hypothetical protein